MVGEIVFIQQQELVCILTILIGKDLVNTIINKGELNDLREGGQELVAKKAFNPNSKENKGLIISRPLLS